MPKAFFKHKVLLDENMPHRRDFPLLNQNFDVKHIVKDLHQSGVDDPKVYEIAVSQRRIILTRNIKHFVSLVGKHNDFGVIAIPPHWQREQLDRKVSALLKKQNQAYFRGKLITLTDEGSHNS